MKAHQDSCQSGVTNKLMINNKPTHGLPATGQTGCWDSSGGSITCADTGQDGDIQAGVALPDPRFTDNGDGTVTDNLTGLIWLINANCFGEQTWTQARSVMPRD